MNEYMTSSPSRASASFMISAAQGESLILEGEPLSFRVASLVRAITVGERSSSGEVNPRGDGSVADCVGVTTGVAPEAEACGRLVSFCARPAGDDAITRTRPAIQIGVTGVFIEIASSCLS